MKQAIGDPLHSLQVYPRATWFIIALVVCSLLIGTSVSILGSYGVFAALLPLILVPIALFVRRPMWFVTCYALYIPFEEFILKWMPVSVYGPLRYLGEVGIFVLLVVVLLLHLFSKGTWSLTPIDIPLIVLLGGVLFSTLVNRMPLIVTLLGIKNLIRYIGLYYLVVLWNPSDRFIRGFLKALGVIPFVQAALTIAQVIVGEPAYQFLAPQAVSIGGEFIRTAGADLASFHSKAFGTMARYNMLGNYLAIWIVFFITSKLMDKSRLLRIGWGGLGVLCTSLALTYSRMSWVALVFSILAILWWIGKKAATLVLVAVFILSTVLGLLATEDIDINEVDQGMTSPVERYLGLFTADYLRVKLQAGRLHSYTSILPRVLNVAPLFGLGPGTIASDVLALFPTYSSEQRLGIDPWPLRFLGDAGYVALSAQLGLVGLLAVIAILMALLHTGLNLYREGDGEWSAFGLGYAGVVIAMMFFNLVSYSLTYRIPGFYFWLFSSLIVVLQRRNHYEEE